MTGLLQQRRYYWVNSKESQAHQSFCEYFSEVLTKKIITAASPLVFLCIGTPLIAGDTLGPQTGSRLVKKETGNTFLEILTRVRMEQACNMLRDPNNKVYEIALAVGIKDSKYFSQIFKRYYGMTPVEFRQNLLNNNNPLEVGADER